MLYDQKELLTFHYVSRSPVFDLYATNTLNMGDLPQCKYTLSRRCCATNSGRRPPSTHCPSR